MPYFIPKFFDGLIESSKEAMVPMPPTVLLTTIAKGLNEVVANAVPALLAGMKQTIGDAEFIKKMAPLIKSYILAQIEAFIAERRWSTYNAAQGFETNVRLQQGVVQVTDFLSEKLDQLAKTSTNKREWLERVEKLVQDVVLQPGKSGGAKSRRSRRRRSRSRRRLRKR